MKKNGFTLAEVLITLAIIGVIATMTLPSLMTNTQEQQAKTGLKKAINTLNNAAEMNAAATGFDFVSITSVDTKDDQAQSLFAILANRTQVDYGKSGDAAPDTQTSKFEDAKTWITFRDGSSLGYDAEKSSVEKEKDIAELRADGLPLGFTVVYDTNGAKAPNIVSNCQTTALGVEGADDDDNDEHGIVVGGGKAGSTIANVDVNAACPKASRVIKDQFLIQLRGTVAQPRGAAAMWAYAD